MVLNVLLLLTDEGLKVHDSPCVGSGAEGCLGQHILRNAVEEGYYALILTALWAYEDKESELLSIGKAKTFYLH